MKDNHNVVLKKMDDEFRGLGDDLIAPTVEDDGKVAVSRAKKTVKQKALRVMLKRSGLRKPPLVERILEGKTGLKIPISEIGFISSDKQDDPLLVELAKECPVRNRLNRHDIIRNRILAVGSEIFKAQKMWTPIHVARDLASGKIECISGRHRLAFLALVYGSDLEIPVYVEHMTLKAAREAVAVANDARPIKAIERASYAILRAVGGDSAADQTKLYDKLATHKNNVIKYCVYSVIERNYPATLDFKLSELSSRPDGGITTVSNIEEFWGEAIPWTKNMSQKEFDQRLLESINFINSFVADIQKMKGFNPDQHLMSNVLSAIGRYCQTYQSVTSKTYVVLSDVLAKVVIAIQPSTKKSTFDIFGELCKQMTK